VRGIAAGLVLGLAASAIVASCTHQGIVDTGSKRDLVNQLWVQIRQWRHERGWDLDPPKPIEMQYRRKTVKETRKVCPDGHAPPKVCHDTCNLADDICDNAETICSIADELKDEFAQDKCASAKASCREAKQRCCDCEAKPAATDVPFDAPKDGAP
jgi:hypothetical protein